MTMNSQVLQSYGSQAPTVLFQATVGVYAENRKSRVTCNYERRTFPQPKTWVSGASVSETARKAPAKLARASR